MGGKRIETHLFTEGGVANFIQQPTFPILHQQTQSTLKMSYRNDSPATDEASPEPRVLSSWNSVWTSNKGVVFIVLAQAVGSSMDAIVRFLQQGGHGMHPFQVREPRSVQRNYIDLFRLSLPA